MLGLVFQQNSSVPYRADYNHLDCRKWHSHYTSLVSYFWRVLPVIAYGNSTQFRPGDLANIHRPNTVCMAPCTQFHPMLKSIAIHIQISIESMVLASKLSDGHY